LANKGKEFEISAFLGSFDVTSATIEQIERLEDYIREANTVANMKTGETLVVDAIYDEMVDILKQVKPESPLLTELWETEDETNVAGNQYTALLKQNPMKSIQTVKSFDSKEMLEFLNNFPDEPTTLHMSMKLNGWGIRIVYLNRQFVSATSRARSSAGRDLTRQLGIVLEKMGMLTLPDDVSDELVEIRGELVLPFYNLEKAREYNPSIVSAFSGVASMARDSASDDEVALLDFVAYKAIMDGLEFGTQTEQYNFLEDLGFKTPMYWIVENVTKDELIETLEDVLDEISEEVFNEENSYEYFTDGVVVQVDDYAVYHAMGDGTKYDAGNIALKLGDWSQDNYYGYVQFIEYSRGKSKLSPVAIISSQPNEAIFDINGELYYGMDDLLIEVNIEDGKYDLMECVTNYNELGVATANGNRVRRVPLYEPMNLLRLGVKPNSILHFKYGGEAGVVPCFEDGSLLKGSKGVDYIDTLFDEY
jgi:NAD-dependent DNA ligase